MNRTTVALTAAFGAIVLELAILLVSEAVGANESFVAVDGIIALASVDVLTGVVMRPPNPSGGEYSNDGGHI